MRITIKPWIYNKAQESAGGLRTLAWDEAKAWIGETPIEDININTEEGLKEFFREDNWCKAYHLYGEVTRETDKAVLFEADYWDLRYCRDVSLAPLRKGWKVWIPKSSIFEIRGKKAA
jgi:hypothetical protein